ncbi:MAG: PQQ-dependent sugar dehydrogenase [Flavobacteriales bacterium]|nr:PQQ-dependent sugar dehydrogenase [Flavobacteriales bacterium]MCB9180027.1 PQQ-dependent sugar dehydrogenase [Flavobacteriales bacterium]MCB9199667.1 PQQ-dependent sugar dehydrogenase [Flavobacteriales bacterium]
MRNMFILVMLQGSLLSAQTTFLVGSTSVEATTVAQGLDVPWDLVLGPDGMVWFTEANGNIHRLDLSTNTLELVHQVQDVVLSGFTAGLHSMAFHPDFTNEPYVYVHYMNSTTSSVVERFLYDQGTNSFGGGSGHLLSVPIPGGASHNGSRLVEDGTGNFILTMGDHMTGSALVQDLNAVEGKFLRFDPLGGVPADNPIAGSYVYNWGHRNPQGLVHASNGIWYNSAHGQGFDDEVNVVLPDRDYGWPTVLGLCNTPAEMAYCTANNVVEPIHEFTTEIVAPCGLDHYDHPAIPGWQNSLLIATLRGKALWQLQLDPTGTQVTAAQPFLSNVLGRLRDVLVLPDGRVLVCTSNKDWSGTPGPMDDRLVLLTAQTSTALTELDRMGPRLFPNPGRAGHASIVLPEGTYDVVVHDIVGRQITAHTAVQGSLILGTEFRAGRYQVLVEGEAGRWLLPWVVTR